MLITFIMWHLDKFLKNNHDIVAFRQVFEE